MIANIIDDSHCGMSDVAFRTASPIGGLSCYFSRIKRFLVSFTDSVAMQSQELDDECDEL